MASNAPAHASRGRAGRFLLILAVVVLTSSLSACLDESPDGIGTKPAPGSNNVAGIKAESRLYMTVTGKSVLEVTITTLRRQLDHSCPDSADCPSEFVSRVRSSALVDYRLSAIGETDELVVENAVDAIGSVVQVLTFENIEPGEHCIAVFSQLLQVDNGAVVGNEGMIGTYEHVTLSADSSTLARGTNRCSTSGLDPPDGSFVPRQEVGCGGLPNGITTDPNGDKLSDNELSVVVPTCPQDLVVVTFRDGKPDVTEIRLLSGEPDPGFFAYTLPRPQGRWRVATLPVESYRGTLPDESGYWDVVISPPREF